MNRFQARSEAALPYARASLKAAKFGPAFKAFLAMLLPFLMKILPLLLMSDDRAQKVSSSRLMGADPALTDADYDPVFMQAMHEVEGRDNANR